MIQRDSAPKDCLSQKKEDVKENTAISQHLFPSSLISQKSVIHTRRPRSTWCLLSSSLLGEAMSIVQAPCGGQILSVGIGKQ